MSEVVSVYRKIVEAHAALDAARDATYTLEMATTGLPSPYLTDEIKAWLAGYDYAMAQQQVEESGELRDVVVFSDGSIWAGVSDEKTKTYVPDVMEQTRRATAVIRYHAQPASTAQDGAERDTTYVPRTARLSAF